MDAIVRGLFEFIPEVLRPYAALALVILYVITKARSSTKTKQIKGLLIVIRPKPKEGDRGLGSIEQESGWRKVVDALF